MSDHSTSSSPNVKTGTSPSQLKSFLSGHGSNSGNHEESEPWLISYADLMTLLVGFFVILLSFSTIDEDKMDALRRAITEKFGGNFEIPFSDLAEKLKAELNKLGVGDQFVIKTNSGGLEISFHGTVFFNMGSADIKPEAIELLNKLVPRIKAEATAFDIVVEGHTDDVPIASGNMYHNNWELSSIRACRVLEFFDEMGFPKKTLTALGYGETRPILPNRDGSGKAIPENQSQNRRVVIKMIRTTASPLGTENAKAQDDQQEFKTTKEESSNG